jgi:NAD(P)-dependent dehydrogenase (short-subunit alcohol dehydrogenase family)
MVMANAGCLRRLLAALALRARAASSPQPHRGHAGGELWRRITSWDVVGPAIVERVLRQLRVHPSPVAEEALRRHPAVANLPTAEGPAAGAVVPLEIRAGDRVARLLSTIATLGTAQGITISDLRVELVFPMPAKHAIGPLAKRQGRLVLIGSVGSVAAMVCAPGFAPYHASKYAVRAIGQTLAMELHGTGVTSTTIHPGFVESEIAQARRSAPTSRGRRRLPGSSPSPIGCSPGSATTTACRHDASASPRVTPCAATRGRGTFASLATWSSAPRCSPTVR